jgi:hypothetical protein
VHKDLKFGASKEPLNHPRFSTDPFDGIAEFAAEMGQIETAQVPELDPFQMPPEAFAGIQFGGIGWQALDVKPLSRSIGQERLDDTATMNRSPIPHDDHATGHLPQHMFQEGDHIRRVDGVILAVEIQLALEGERADRREMIMGPPGPQDGGVAHWGIRPHDAGQGIKP